MSQNEHTQKTLGPTTGLSALLAGLLRSRGTGAPKGTGAPRRTGAPNTGSVDPDGRVSGVANRPVQARVCSRGSRPRFYLALAIVLLTSLLVAVPAPAAQTRLVSNTFGCAVGSAGCETPDPAPLSNPQGIAVDNETGDVYVADTGNNRVQKFSSTGEFQLTFGGDVGGPGIDTCTALCSKGTAGSAPGQFESVKFIAVDNDPSSASFHDIYVADTADNEVSKFTPEGKLVASWGVGGQAGGACEKEKELLPCGGSSLVSFTESKGVAVTSTGMLAVLDRGEEPHQLFELEQDGGSVTHFEVPKESAADGLAVNSEGDFFKVTGGLRVFELDPSGTPIGFVTLEGGGFPYVGPLSMNANDELYYIGTDNTLNHDALSGGEVVESGGKCKPGPEESEGCAPTDSVPIGFTGSGIAAKSDSEVFVSNAGANEEYEYGAYVTVPDVQTAAPEPGARDITLKGTVKPDEVAVTKCQFEYVEAAKYKATAADPYEAGGVAECEPGVAAIDGKLNEEVSVQAKAVGLSPNTTYDYRLLAANANDESKPQVTPNETVATFPPPSIEGETVSDLTASSVTLRAMIDPEHAATRYHFEYDTQPYAVGGEGHGVRVPACSASQAECEAKDPLLAAGGVAVSVSAAIRELHADERPYYWRVVASNESGQAIGSEHSFIYSLAAAGLPDGRAYEMVTPSRKNGALVGAVSGFGVQPDVAASGQRVMASSIQCFAAAEGCHAKQENVIGSPYEFQRTGNGWVTVPLSAPASEYGQSADWAYSAQEGTALLSTANGTSGEDDFYVREASGRFVKMGPDTPPEDGAHGPRGGRASSEEQAHTADFSHFVWNALYLWASPFAEETLQVYEYAPGVSRRPLDVGVAGGFENGENHNLVSECGTILGSASDTFSSPGSMSADGRTVFFTAMWAHGGVPCPGAFGEVKEPEVYARVDGESAGAHTVAVSEPSPSQCGTGEGADEVACRSAPVSGAMFMAGSEDGSNAVFLSTQQLTDGASQDPNSNDEAALSSRTPRGCRETVGANGCNLYVFEGVTAGEASERHLLDASEGEGVVVGGPRVQGVVAVSPASVGERVFFVAKGMLTGRERAGCMAEWTAAGRAGEADCRAVDGANNLYVYSTGSHTVQFIAPLASEDLKEWEFEVGKPANVTPDGRFLVFLSGAHLTADDTSRSQANQVFRYDAQTGSLLRLSIGSDGFNDNGNRSTPTPCLRTVFCSEAATIVPAERQARSDPSMSDNGSRVFFNSPVALTPHALDDVQITTANVAFGNSEELPVYAENVYEWEAEGVGSCTRGHVGGCVFLISDGRDVAVDHGGDDVCTTEYASASCLLGSDASGDNVFITTGDQLLGSDTNTEVDYYDVRVCEPEHGNPCIVSPPPPSPGCSGEECHGVPAGTPGGSPRPTATFDGQGNVSPSTGKPSPRVATRAQKLARALSSCRRRYKRRAERRRCEAQARVRYGTKAKHAKRARHDRGAGR